MIIAETLFGITVIAYFAASMLYIWSLVDKHHRVIGAATISAASGLAAQGIGIVLRGIIVGHVPLTNLYESLTFVAWASMAIYLIMERKQRVAALGAFVSLVALIATACTTLLPREINPALTPALQSRWSAIHVISSLAAYASFILAFAATLGYIIQERLLKSKRINALQQQLPSLDAVDHLAYKMVALGFPMLTLGVVTGALWAQTAWGSYWNWDPKETWSLVTWLVYAAYLHMRIVRGWRGKWANRLLLIGFGAVLVTFFGVNFIPHGLHRY